MRNPLLNIMLRWHRNNNTILGWRPGLVVLSSENEGLGTPKLQAWLSGIPLVHNIYCGIDAHFTSPHSFYARPAHDHRSKQVHFHIYNPPSCNIVLPTRLPPMQTAPSHPRPPAGDHSSFKVYPWGVTGPVRGAP